MDALSHAERQAYENPTTHCVVYRRREAHADRFYVRLADDAAPDGAEKFVTVSRKPPRVRAGKLTLKDAVIHMFDNLPEGVELVDRVLIEHYPKKPYDSVAEIFAYEFFTTEGLNIGTWIPDVDMGKGVNIIAGFEGRGRPYPSAFRNGQVVGPSEGIERALRCAKVKELDPGNDCTPLFIEGWREAEAYLRTDVDPDDESPNYKSEEKFNGYIGRMAEERRIRAGTIVVTKPEKARPQVLGNLTEGIEPVTRRFRP